MFRARAISIAIAAASVTAALPWLSTPASADTPTILGAQLSPGRWSDPVIWTGEEAVVLGGTTGTSVSEVVHYNPTTGAMRSATNALPGGVSAAGVAWDGQFAYVFGGYAATGASLSDIKRYDVATDTYAVVPSLGLPGPRHGVSAFWSGSAAYVIGGTDGVSSAGDILKFDFVAGTRTRVATIPARDHASVVWTGTDAYIFGGYRRGGGIQVLNDVIRFNPSTGVATMLPVTIPNGANTYAGGIYDGAFIKLNGGWTGAINVKDILPFDPRTETFRSVTSKLLTAESGGGAVWTGDRTLIFGGNSNNVGLQTIVSIASSNVRLQAYPSQRATLPSGAPGVAHDQAGFEVVVPKTGLDLTIDMADLAHKSDWVSPAPYSLELQADATGSALDRSFANNVTLADFFWEGQGPIPVGLDGPIDVAGTLTYTLKNALVPASLVHAGVNHVKLVPRQDFGWQLIVHEVSLELAAAPVIIVHGWSPSFDVPTQWQPSAWAPAVVSGLQDRAASDFGRNPWAWLPSDKRIVAYGYDPKQDFRLSARDLQHQIDLMHAGGSGYVGKIGIYAHSMGGLVSRWLIEKNGGSSQVGALVTVGTPSRGSDRAVGYTNVQEASVYLNAFNHANYFYATKRGDALHVENFFTLFSNVGGSFLWKPWAEDSTGAYLRTNGRNTLADFELFPVSGNAILGKLSNDAVPTGVRYDMIAGQRLTETDPIRHFLVAEAGDLVVPVWSATNENDPGGCFDVISTQLAPPDMHDWLPSQSVVHERAMRTLTGTLPSIQCRVNGQPSTGTALRDPTPIGVAKRPTSWSFLGGTCSFCQSGAAPQSSQVPSGTFTSAPAPGPSASAKFDLENVTSATFTLSFLATPDGVPATLALVDPSGALWDAAHAGDVRASFQEGFDGMMGFARFVVSTPANGTWTLVVSATSDLPPNGTAVAMDADYESPVRLTRVSTEAPQLPGNTTTLVVRVAADSASIGGAEVSAVVTDPETGSVTRLVMVEVGNGTYSVDYRGVTLGAHGAIVTAKGAWAGGGFNETLITALTYALPFEAPCLGSAPSTLGLTRTDALLSCASDSSGVRP